MGLQAQQLYRFAGDLFLFLGEDHDDPGGRLSPGVLTSVCRLDDQDVDALTSAIAWLAEHPALDEWTARQLPVRGTHSKWVESHRSLLTRITGRDLEAEIRPRLAVVHLTYLDPDYVATGGRRHDAWTSGDRHSLGPPGGTTRGCPLPVLRTIPHAA